MSPRDDDEVPHDLESFVARMGGGDGLAADLASYERLLAEASQRMNLIGPSVLRELWPRHIFDSAQLHLMAPEARSFIDVGAGAGFPGIILAVLLKRSGGRVHLIEAQAKRCRFLQMVVNELSLPATIHHYRAEDMPELSAEIVTARACAPLVRLLGFAAPFLIRGSRGLFLKGREAAAEVAAAHRTWRFDSELLPSLSDPSGHIVSVRRLARA